MINNKAFFGSKEYFNPRFPYGSRLLSMIKNTFLRDNFNPRLPYGRRRYAKPVLSRFFLISIHASHTGDDGVVTANGTVTSDFNPRLPYGRRLLCRLPLAVFCYFNPRLPYGRRLSLIDFSQSSGLFQSTPPIQETTLTRQRVR